MTEQDGTMHQAGIHEAGVHQAGVDQDPPEVATTGHAQVDDVLSTLDSLADLPVDQHVAVFEAAHAGLRDALSGAAPAAANHG